MVCAGPEEWRAWLEKHHAGEQGAWLKIAKKKSGIASVSHAEALDVAICFGWIDAVRHAHDDDWFLQRFTPRRARSKWSQVNRDKAERLIATGEMRPPGLAEVERAKADGRWDAAYEPQSQATVPDDLQAELDANRRRPPPSRPCRARTATRSSTGCATPSGRRRARGGWRSSWPCSSVARRCTRSERITIGSAIAYAFGHTPLVLAAEARDLDALSGGRIILGLGTGTKRMQQDWHGLDGEHPASRMEELVPLLRRLLAPARGADRARRPLLPAGRPAHRAGGPAAARRPAHLHGRREPAHGRGRGRGLRRARRPPAVHARVRGRGRAPGACARRRAGRPRRAADRRLRDLLGRRRSRRGPPRRRRDRRLQLVGQDLPRHRLTGSSPRPRRSAPPQGAATGRR